MTSSQIIKALKRLANPDIAVHSQRFFKTGKGDYGEGDRFLGIRVPVLRQQVKQFQQTPLDEIRKLLRSPIHEARLLALLLLVRRYHIGGENDKTAIYRMYLDNTDCINNWDLVDSSAQHIVGAHLETRDREMLYLLAESGSLWERRIAIMSTFHFIRINQFDDTLNIARQLVEDPEDLIHKAVGWMLREVGKRDLSCETEFLNSHYQKMPRTMLRYAIEKFPEAQRKRYLLGEV